MYYPKDLRKEFPPALDRAYEQQRKNQKVRDVMTENPETTTPDKTMDEAIRVMGDKHIGSLIVLEDGRPRGIVTERDLFTGILAKGKDPSQITVRAIMSTPLVSIPVDATVKEAAKLMIQKKGRLAVFEKDKLIGIVTASDLTRTLPNVPETQAKVEAYMSRNPVSMDESKRIREAVKVMGVKRIGSVIVTRSGEPFGIFTERDVLSRFLAQGKSLDVPLGENVSSPLVVAPAWITVTEAAYIMSSQYVRRLPLVDDAEKLVGIVTARDLVEAYAQ